MACCRKAGLNVRMLIYHVLGKIPAVFSNCIKIKLNFVILMKMTKLSLTLTIITYKI